MNALTCIEKLTHTSLINLPLKYCLVTDDKKPVRFDGTIARPNNVDDFVELYQLCDLAENYAGIGVSIQASKVFAIDVDHCFSIVNDIHSGDKRANSILNMFKDIAYCEFSFSGTGLRVLFNAEIVDDYSSKYYIKNSKQNIEFYQPTQSFRYVTVTGNTISDNFSKVSQEVLIAFLEKYMKKTEKKRDVKSVEDKPIEVLQSRVRYLYLTNHRFQDLWFGKAPGSGKDESERDFQIMSILYENITQNKEKLKLLFEISPYFKSKDWKHMKKWEQQDFRYFEYVFSQIERRD